MKVSISFLSFIVFGFTNLIANTTNNNISDITNLERDTVSFTTDTIEEIEDEITLQEFVISKKQKGVRKLKDSALNTDVISKAELLRAACCNLGESFVTNASVDVNYNDAATGAKQIKLLGLAGSYVQMLTENIPNLRGAASLYGLGYIPGPWMQSIQVSKGASSVKNGYESVTGQINIEFLKPQTDQSFMGNAYIDWFGKAELNAAGNIHINKKWSTGVLLHAENGFASHDDNNDGFIYLPRIRQFTGMNRWAYMGDNYIFQAGVRFLTENRLSGQDTHHHQMAESDIEATSKPYKIDINTNRWEIFAKNALFLDKENEENIALILSGSIHSENASYGNKIYDVDQDNGYASLIYERKWNEGIHGISAGLSFNIDRYKQTFRLSHNILENTAKQTDTESTTGGYAQYTFNLNSNFIMMAGLRYDYSNIYHSMLTPRVHVKWILLNDAISLHASAGRGYRSPHPLAENHFYMASSRKIIIGSDLHQEVAMNYGGGISGFLTLADRSFNYNAEFYYTRFSHQLLVDLETDPHAVIIKDSENKPNFSKTFQVELSYPIISDMTISAAYRYTDVMVDYGQGLVSKPLTSKHKGLFSINWAPMMGIWQADVTLAINGGGRMPTPYTLENGDLSWNSTYKTFPQLNAQITKNFRHWSIYIGGENLTGYKQKTPIIDAANPWGDNFDSTMIYGPIHGPMVYVGFRYNFTKY